MKPQHLFLAAALSLSWSSTLSGQEVFTSPTTVVSIPDDTVAGVSASLIVNTGAPSSLNSFDSITIHGLNHTWVGDLRASVTHVPTGTSAILFDRVLGDFSPGSSIGDASNFTFGDYVFLPGALDTVDSASIVGDLVAGTYAPASQTPGNSVDSGANPGVNDTLVDFLSFSGIDPNGEWIFAISDNFGGDLGSFSGFSITLNYSLLLELLDVALTEDQLAVATALDPLVGASGNPSDLDDLFTDLSALSDAEIRAALDQMTPRQMSVIPQVFASHNASQTRNLWNRLVQLRRNAGTATEAVQLDIQDVSGNQSSVASTRGVSVAAGGGAEEDAEAQPKGWGLFAIGTGQAGDVDETREEIGFDFQTTGINVGGDYFINDNLAGGLTLGYSSGDAELDDNSGKTEIDSLKLGIFGTYFQTDPSDATRSWYLNGYIGGGYNEYDFRRKVSAGASSARITSDTDGYELNSVFGGGYDIQMGKLTYGLLANIRYDHLWVDEYTENGSSALALEVDDQDFDSLRSELGLRLAYSVEAQDIMWHWGATLSWQHEFMDTEESVKARFQNVGGSFDTDIYQDISPDTLNFGASLVGQITQATSVGVSYFTELNEDFTSHAVSVEFGYTF